MKARVNRTGKIVTIMENTGYPGGYVASDGRTYRDEDLTLIVDEEPDYWTRLEHQYVGMFMTSFLDNFDGTASMEQLAESAKDLARALVKKMKEER